MPLQPIDLLLERVISQDAAAWASLVGEIAPTIDAIARSNSAMRSRGLAALADDVAEVRTASLERLRRGDFDNLRRYLAQRTTAGRPQSFDSWLYGNVEFAIREHLRQRFGRAPKPSLEPLAIPAPSKRELNTQAELWDEQAQSGPPQNVFGLTTKLHMAHILQYMEAHFSRDERSAMQMHYADERSFADIAEALGMSDASMAEKLIRRLNARLRHRFASVSTE